MSKLDVAETEVKAASDAIESAITLKQTDLERRRARARSILQRVAVLKARCVRYGVAVPQGLLAVETLLTTDEELATVS